MSTVSEIASNKGIVIITADTGKSAYDVADLMKNKKVGSVIVLDKESQPLGIITERDMVKRVCLKNLAASRIKAEEIGSVETTEYYTKICQSVDVVCYTSE
jgi:signal-transduction protein with cAMP-binding, CBS, and nucleotidyltransferase domain